MKVLENDVNKLGVMSDFRLWSDGVAVSGNINITTSPLSVQDSHVNTHHLEPKKKHLNQLLKMDSKEDKKEIDPFVSDQLTDSEKNKDSAFPLSDVAKIAIATILLSGGLTWLILNLGS